MRNLKKSANLLVVGRFHPDSPPGLMECFVQYFFYTSSCPQRKLKLIFPNKIGSEGGRGTPIQQVPFFVSGVGSIGVTGPRVIRFDIFEEVSCVPTTNDKWQAKVRALGDSIGSIARKHLGQIRRCLLGPEFYSGLTH